MEWLTTSISIVLIIICPLWTYLWWTKLLEKKQVVNPIARHYTVPEWNFCLKRWWAAHCIENAKQKQIERLQSSLKNTAKDGTLVKKLPKELEDLRILKDEDSSDSTFFYAADQKGNFVFISLAFTRHRIAELILHLHLADGRIYQLPNHPDSVIFNNSSRGWSAGGLKITPLEQWRRWRITFNGLLRNGIRRNYRADEGHIEHVRFNFIYIAAARPLLWPKDWSSSLQADALAREPWRDPQWIDMIKSDQTGGFDHWGTLTGQIIFEDSSSNDLYLRGLRQRRWGRRNASHLHRIVNIVGVTHDGAMYCLGASSSKEGLTHMQFGHIRQANELLYPIDWMDFDLAFYAEHRENIPTRYNVNFQAGGKKYSLLISRIMDTGATLFGGHPWDWEARVFNTETKLNYDEGFGIAYLWYNYDGPCPVYPVPRISHLLPLDIKGELNLYTVPFENRVCRSEAVVGGKGSSIALLMTVPDKEFVVPRGFCITVAALNLQIESNNKLSDAVNYVESVSTGKLDGDLKQACEKAVALFERIPILHCIQAAINQSILDLDTYLQAESMKGGKHERFAVRSSAVGEDSKDTSAAGQNATFLGLRGPENIIKAVAKCWGSLYAYQSVEYRRQHGQPVVAEMGVCVQQMVDAEAAGVMFTRHPTTGDPREVLITANYGLGESVVSAMIEPDMVIVERSWSNEMNIKEIKLGKKTLKISMTPYEGTTTEVLTEFENQDPCISEEVALKLSKLGIQLEMLFGSPRDIEWAVVRGEIFLLQARPITALDAWTDFEIIHELDSPVPSEIDTVIFSNIGEVFPGAVSPLTLSTIIRLLNNAIEVNSLNAPANPYYEHCVSTVAMRCCLHYLNVMLKHVESKITLGNKVVEIAVSGHVVLTPEIHASAKRRNNAIGIRSKLKLFKNMFQDTWNNDMIVEKAKKVHKTMKLDSESFARAEHLYSVIDDNLSKFFEVSMAHSHTSRVSVFCQVFAMTVLTEGSQEFTTDHYSDVALLLSSCSDVVSAQVPSALRKLGQTIKNSGKIEEFVQIDPKYAKDWLNLNCTPAAIMFDDFLKLHGDRTIREFDLMTETWEMKPEQLLATLQVSAEASGEFPISEELTAAETVDRLKTPKRSLTRRILKLLVPLNRSAVMRRELTKSISISIVNKLRLAYRRLAQLMVEDGRLPDKNLIFFLTHPEIGLLLSKQDPSLVQKAVRRRRLYPYCDKLRFPEVITGVVKPLEAESHAQIREGGAQVSGTPVCGGSVYGRACVITDVKDAVQLKPGDILITIATDIGWSPYFPMLGGVVTELGGLISHGAVVAREYGLPCIVGAERATQMFCTGDSVLLIGTTGVLQVVEEIK